MTRNEFIATTAARLAVGEPRHADDVRGSVDD